MTVNQRMIIIPSLSFLKKCQFWLHCSVSGEKRDTSVKRRILFLVPFIPFIVFETQFAQISTNVNPVRVLMEKSVLMEWTCILVPVLLALLLLIAQQVCYKVQSDYNLHRYTFGIKQLLISNQEIIDKEQRGNLE